MIEENMLRGSLVSSNEAKGGLGFKGERGYSAYEIAVQNGFIGTEQDWLATLGTSSHFTKDKAVYTTSSSQTVFNTPSSVITGDIVDVYVNGIRLNEDEYTVGSSSVTLASAVLSGNTVEVIQENMSTNDLPISTTINSSSTNDTASGTKSVYDYIESVKTALVNTIYPVDSIYISVSSTNPSTLFGGTWEQIEDTFLLSAGETYTAGDTGGEATHTLTIDELPSHSHGIHLKAPFTIQTNGGTEFGALYDSTVTNGAYVTNTGGGEAHNNMPPYLVVYMWKRTA